MKTTLLHQVSLIPRLTATAGKAERLVHDYVGWELLDVDYRAQEILICKRCAPPWEYTRSQHLLILCGQAAIAWQRNAAASAKARAN